MDIIVKLFPRLDAANKVARLFVNVTLLLPLFERVIAPVKLLLAPLVVRLMALAPALKLEVPGTVKAPFCVMAPFDIIVKLFPTLDAANKVARLFVNVTSLAPLFERVMAPVKLLLAPLVLRLMALAPALKLDVPGTVKAPF